MTARQKIEGLTNSWYGYTVFGAALSLWQNGIGLFSLMGTAAWFVFNIFLVWFIGRRLLHKGSLTRLVLVIVTALGSVFGTIATAKMGWTFFQTWSLSVAMYAGITGLAVYMNARSFKVLTDSSVKAYFNSAA
jgi:hypothetical protein